jgi:hypothetical protein
MSVPVYKRVPQDATNYVWLRLESGFDSSNKKSFNDDITIITEIVTQFNNVGDDSVMEGIDSEIVNKIMSGPGQSTLTASGLQIMNIKRDQHYPPEEMDGTNIYLRKISRYTNHVHQT